MKQFLLAIICLVLSGCATMLPQPLPPAPEVVADLQQIQWPLAPQTLRIEGTISIRSNVIPVRGMIAVDPASRTVKAALLSQMGTSILEAALSQDDYTIATASPLIKKYPLIKPVMIKMLRAIYLPLPLQKKLAGKKGNVVQLRDDTQEIVYMYKAIETSTKYELSQRINQDNQTIVNFSSWTNASKNQPYPQEIFYQDNMYGVSATIQQLPLSQRGIE